MRGDRHSKIQIHLLTAAPGNAGLPDRANAVSGRYRSELIEDVIDLHTAS
jgi:hypothetical protein